MTSYFTLDQRRQLRQLKQSMAVIAELSVTNPDDHRYWTIAAAHARAALGLIEKALPHLHPLDDSDPDLLDMRQPYEITLENGKKMMEWTEVVEVETDPQTPDELAIIEVIQSLHQQIVVLVAGLVAVAADMERVADIEADSQ
ncbi:MAG: hypothetical protein LCI00_04755 [Chloroflexi bacterium]|nr:hypothetical protein [Chloroflexota bacterium]MCC6896363.1 hypothetical protein [Anaerolineae bacterium]